MRVHAKQQDNVTVLEFVAGDVLDCYVAADVKAQAFRQLEGRTDVVIALANLEFIDSAGLGVLVGIYKRVKLRGRRVVVAGARPYVTHVMQVIKLDRVFEAFEDVPSAVAALSADAVPESAGTGTPR